MRKKLSKSDEEYIMNHREDLDVQALMKHLDAAEETVQEYLDTLPPPSEPGESLEERRRKLQSTTVGVGKMMARDPKRGVVVMTEAASELADARTVIALKKASEDRKKKMRGQIHRPFEDSEYDR